MGCGKVFGGVGGGMRKCGGRCGKVCWGVGGRRGQKFGWCGEMGVWRTCHVSVGCVMKC